MNANIVFVQCCLTLNRFIYNVHHAIFFQLYFEQKLQEIQRHTCSQEKSIQNLMAAKEVFMKEMYHCEQYTDKSQLKAQYSIKKELEAMKTRLVSKNQQDELENIKRCLQQSFSVG